MTDERKLEMNKVLKAYQDQCRMEHIAYRNKDELSANLDKLCSAEQGQFTRAVNKVMKNARKEWTVPYAGTHCEVLINHATAPYSYSIGVRVEVYFYADQQRGKIELNGNISKMSDVLHELKMLVKQPAPVG